MKITVFPLVGFAVAGLLCPFGRGAEPPRSRFGDNPGDNAVLKAVVPQEFGLFTSANAKGANARMADAVLNLVSATNRILVAFDRDPRAPRSEKNARAEVAYMLAWEKAIQVWKKTGDDAARARIMAAWNSGLKESPEVELQIDGLWSEWHPAFQTDPFVNLFKATSNPQTVGAFCRVLGHYGQDAEERLLKEKLASVTGQGKADKTNTAIIDAISFGLYQIGYWRERDTARIGPAAISH